MANHTKTVTLTDLQQQILSNDLYNDSDNAGLDAWIQEAVDGKIVALILARSNYQNRKARDDASSIGG